MSRVPSVVSTPDAIRAAVASQGGDGTISPGGLTFGKLVDGGRAGKMLAMYRRVAGTGTATYAIPHNLGIVPGWIMLVACENTEQDPNICATSVRYHKWTATEVFVRVDTVGGAGGVNGTAMWFLIGGER